MKKQKEMTSKDVKSILKEFGAHSEDELVKIVNISWNLTKCTRCGKNLDLLHCRFEDGDPVCYDGCYNG
jgi:hypothetical protein